MQEVCGATKGNNQKRFNETWWFNEEVRYAIKTKKEAYRKWQKSLADEDKENYRISRQEAKRVVAIAKNVALQEIWSGKSNQEKLQKMFRLAKNRKKEKRDITGAACVRDEDGQMLVDSKKVCYRWETYFKELLNEKSGTTNIDNIPKIEGPIQAITEDEVKEAVKSLKNKKAPGPTGLSADIIKAAGQTALLNIFHKIWDTEELPEDFSKSLTIPIYKGKGDL